MLAGAGAEVDQVVGGAHRALVVLDDDHGVAEVAKTLQRRDQLRVVALVEPDRGLVEDVEHADEAGADLRRKPDPLRLAARERRRRALQRQVADPDRDQERQPLLDLAHDEVGDRPLGLGQLDVPDPLERRLGREARVVGDREAADRHREALRPQPGAIARGAGLQRHQALDLLAGLLGVGLLVAALEPGGDPLEARGVAAAAAEAVLVGDRVALAPGALEQDLLIGLRQVLPGHARVDVVGRADRLEQGPVVAGGGAHPARERALGDRQRRVRDAELRIDDALVAEPMAALAGAVGRVEGEDPRLDLGHRGAAVEAGELLAEDQGLAALAGARAGQGLRPGNLGRAVDELDLDQPVGEAGRRLDRLGEALADALLHHEPVDDHRDVVLVALVEGDVLVEAAQLAVDHGAGVALLPHLLEHLPVLALALTDDRGADHELRALGQRRHPVGDLLDRLPGDRLPAVEAVRLADARPEQPQVVVDLGDGADRRARVARGRLLVDRDRRAQPLDRVDVRLVHLPEELPRVGRERLDVAALTLRVDRVEGEARLARAGEPGHDDEGVPRQLDVDAAQVVLARPRDDYLIAGSHRSRLYGSERMFVWVPAERGGG